MEVEIPEWLTKDFIRKALEDGNENNSITVLNIDVDKPIAKGDNYVCEIFRAKVEYQNTGSETLETSLIIKSPIMSPMYEIMLKMGILQKECRVYNEYLPKVDEVLGGINVLTPKSYHSERENVLVLEDLKFGGYVMANRQKQLDFEHCAIALKTLAKYHAVSVKLHEQNPEFVEDIGVEVFFKDTFKDTNQDFSKFNFGIIAAESKNIPELSCYSDQFEEYTNTGWSILTQLVNPQENTFNVLNHGDFWVNNMLFQYEDGKPIGLKLIDLQISRYSSPAIDLLYFLYGSVQEDLRQTKTNELLKIYLTEFNKNLEKFGASQRLTEPELNLMIDTCEFLGLFVSISLFPIIIADPKECTMDMKEVTMDDFKDFTNNPMSSFYRSERFIEVLIKRVAEFEKKGWLNSSINEKESNIPTWLTKEFIKSALENGNEGNSISIENIKIDRPTNKGDNYVCEIFRVEVDYKNLGEALKTFLIIKTPIISEIHLKLMEMGLIQKEVRIYKEYLLKVNEVLGSENLLTGKSYYSAQPNVLVFEDLKSKGYIMVDRQGQLDFNHCVIALKTLAKFHAASVKLHEQNADFVEDIGREILFRETNKNSEFLNIQFSILTEECKTVPELQKYSDVFKKFTETGASTMIRLANPKQYIFNVLNHGDFWMNNMLFRYENKKPVNIKLLDFQMSRYTTPAIDLLYFFYSSVQEDVIDTRFEELLIIYLNELNDDLQKYGALRRLAYSELKSMIETNLFFRLYATITLLAGVIAEPETCNAIDLKSVTEEDLKDTSNNPFNSYYRSKRFRDILRKRMTEFEKNGLF